MKSEVIHYGCALAVAGLLLSPLTSSADDDKGRRGKSFDICVNPQVDVRLDDIDGNMAFSAGDGITVVGIIVPGGTIPTDGVGVQFDCTGIVHKRIGTFFVKGRVVAGLPAAASNDLAYVDWQFRIDGRGAIDTSGPVKVTSQPLETYLQTVTGATGEFKSLKGAVMALVLDGTAGFQFRLLVPNSGGHDSD